MNPNIYFFNPTCEIAIVNGTVSFMPNKFLAGFEYDLDCLPLYFSKKTDVVLVNKIPDNKFITELNEDGIETPEFRIYSEAIRDNSFLKQEKNELRPWGWSPRVHHQLKGFKANCSEEFLSLACANWDISHKDLYSRTTALKVLSHYIENNKSIYNISDKKLAVVCKSVEEVKKYQEKWKQVILKAPWSSAGRGIQILRKQSLNTSIEKWIIGFIKQQGYIMLEALLDKKADCSFHFYSDGKGNIEFKGLGYFYANEHGQYKKNYLGNLPDYIKNLTQNIDLEKIAKNLIPSLKVSNIQDLYRGYLGVDCILFEEDNIIKVQPCVEINLRYNMGTIAIILNKIVDKSKTASFNIFADRDIKYQDFCSEMQIKHPKEIKDGKWQKGFFPLISPYQEKTFGAYILVE